LLILNVGKIIDVSFEKVLLMQSSLNLEASDVISTYVYRRGLLKADYSYGTAVGLLNGIVSITMVLGTNKIAKSLSGSGLW
jgi:ABC-type polysaccharide transport system permease subunit